MTTAPMPLQQRALDLLKQAGLQSAADLAGGRTSPPVSDLRLEGWEPSPAVVDQPLFRTQNFAPRVLLGDSQTHLAALTTDPMSGEVLKLEGTLTVVK